MSHRTIVWIANPFADSAVYCGTKRCSTNLDNSDADGNGQTIFLWCSSHGD